MWMSVSPPILKSSVLLYSEHPAQIKECKQYETGINFITIKEYIFFGSPSEYLLSTTEKNKIKKSGS